MNIELFKKKLQLVGSVKVSEGRLNFGKLFKDGQLSVVKLTVFNESKFRYSWEDDTPEKKLARFTENLKVNYQDDKDKSGFCTRSVWGTYSGLIDVTLMHSQEDGCTVKVTVNDGENMYGKYRGIRFTVRFKIEDFNPFIEVWEGALSRESYSLARDVRLAQIKKEEKLLILAIESQLLNDLEGE